jgi:hypothetical protein
LCSSIQESTTLRHLHIAAPGTNACPPREDFITKDFDASAVVARF